MASTSNTEPKSIEVYHFLKEDILSDPAMEYTEEGRKWVDRMLGYNVLEGKFNKGLSVIESYRLLISGREVSENEFFHAAVLGWCIKWLEACYIVVGDFVDLLHTRSGKLCWSRLPQVGKISINDGSLLCSHIGRILRKHFRCKPYYTDLVELFNEANLQTCIGMLLDHAIDNQGEIELARYFQIVRGKTAYSSFYLPVACALLLDGKNIEENVLLKEITMKIGTYFQVHREYMNYFGVQEVNGKIEAESEDLRCSWFMLQACERANDNQLQQLYDNYGKSDQSSMSKVKALYSELGLQDVFHQYENESSNEIKSLIEALESEPLQIMLKTYLERICMPIK